MNASDAESAARAQKPVFKLTNALFLVFLLFFAFGCSQKPKTAYRPQPLTNPYNVNQNRVNNILKTAFSQLGVPYRYGGNTPETGFDCSGFVGWVYKQYGVSLPRSSRDMMAVGQPIDKEDLRPGDLVFFNYGYSHVGIYTGDDKYIHSPRTGKTITESDLNGRGRKERFVAARRIIDNQGISTISERLKTEWIGQSRLQANLALNEKAARRGSTPIAAKSQPNTFASTKKIKVVSGDTLVDLARKHGVTTAELVAANRLSNKHKLKLGQVLAVPVKAKVSAVAKSNKSLKSKKSGRAANSKRVVKSTKSTRAASNLSAKAKASGKKSAQSVKANTSGQKAKVAKGRSSGKAQAKTTAKADKTAKAYKKGTTFRR
jgi:LysM repeat protein